MHGDRLTTHTGKETWPGKGGSWGGSGDATGLAVGYARECG